MTPTNTITKSTDTDGDEVLCILSKAKLLAQRYRHLTGKPLGITGEVAKYEAARLLGVKLTPARNAGFDATEKKHGSIRKLPIKGRCLLKHCKPGQRRGAIDIEKTFDTVPMVLLHENFEASAVYDAERDAVIKAINGRGSKSRIERWALGVNKFKAIGKLRWPLLQCRK